MTNWRGTWNSGSIYLPGDEIAYAGTVWVCAATATGQVPVPGTYWTPQPVLLGPEPPATASNEGVVALAGDLGGTAAAPQVLSTHLAAALPVNQGGSGAQSAAAAPWTPVPASGEIHYYVSAASGASDANNGLSWGAPLASIANAITLLGGGAGVIELGAGTFTISEPDSYQRTDTGCVTVNGSAVVTDSAALSSDAGAPVVGPGIPSGTVVVSGGSGSFTMSANATASATVSLAIGGNAITLPATHTVLKGQGWGLTEIAVTCPVTWGILLQGADSQVQQLTLYTGTGGSATYGVGVNTAAQVGSCEGCHFTDVQSAPSYGVGTMTHAFAVGGAIWSGGAVDIAETVFTRCTSGIVSGAAFYLGNGVSANILNTHMYGCDAGEQQWGVYANATNFTWTAGTVQHSSYADFWLDACPGAVITGVRSENSCRFLYGAAGSGGSVCTVSDVMAVALGGGGNTNTTGDWINYSGDGTLILNSVRLTAVQSSGTVPCLILGGDQLAVIASGLECEAPISELFSTSPSSGAVVVLTGYVQMSNSTGYIATGVPVVAGPVVLEPTSTGFTFNGVGRDVMLPAPVAGVRTPTAVKTANYTASAGDWVLTSTSSGSLTITLPNAPASGTVIGVEQVAVSGTGTNATTVACAGSDVLDQSGGATSFTMTLLRQSVQLQYNSGAWTRQAISDPFGQVANSRQGVYYLDSYTGTDDAKMASALSAVFTAGGGTIRLSPRSHTFANQWSTSYSSGTITPLRILGAGAVANDIATPNTGGATTVAMSYASSGAARMDFQHIGLIEIAGILFTDSGGSSVPFFQTTNAVPYIHDCTFVGSVTGASCFQDAIVLGGTGTTVGAGDTAPYQGYQGRIVGNTFSGIRRMVLFQSYANSIEVHENLVIGTCGSNLQLGGCIEFSSTVACTGNHIWGNCIEMVHYPCFVRGTSGCSNNTLGPNGLFDATATTIAYYVFLPGATSGNYYNQVIDGYKNDTYPFILDGTNTANIQTIHQSQWSVTLQPQVFGNTTSFSYAPQVYLRDLNGDAAMVYPVLDAANSGGYATIALASANCSQVSDGQTYSASPWLVSLSSAAFASGDLFQPISGTGVQNLSYIQRIASPSTAIPWFTSGTYALGDIARPTSSNGHLYQCTAAGTASGTQPTWPTGGSTVTDGSVVWQDLGTSATAVYMSLPATSTNSSSTVRWGRLATTNVYAEFKRFHLLTQGGTPSGTAGAGAGTSPSGISTAGTDHAFTFSITTGTSPAAGVMFQVAPAQTWTGTPKFAMTATDTSGNAAALMAGGYWLTVSSGTVTAHFVNAPAAATAYSFSFIALV